MDRPLAFALIAGAVLVWLYGSIDVVAHADSGMKYYVPMAEAAPGLDLGQPQPYIYRWLGPWVAGMLPVSAGAAFYGLAVGASLVLVWLMAAVCRADGHSRWAAAGAAALLAANPYLFGFNVYNHYQLNDVWMQVALGGALWLLWQRRYLAMGGVLAVAVLLREPPILMVPVVAVALWERGRLRSDGARAALALVPLVLLFVVPRALLSEPGGMSLAEALVVEGRKAFDPATWARLLVNAWVPVVAVLAVAAGTTWRWLRGHLHLALLFVLTLASAMFGTDQERLMQPAVWAVYPAVAAILDAHWRGRAVAVGVLGVAAVLASLHHLTARFPLPSRPLTAALALVALALAAGAALWVRRTRTAA